MYAFEGLKVSTYLLGAPLGLGEEACEIGAQPGFGGEDANPSLEILGGLIELPQVSVSKCSISGKSRKFSPPGSRLGPSRRRAPLRGRTASSPDCRLCQLRGVPQRIHPAVFRGGVSTALRDVRPLSRRPRCGRAREPRTDQSAEKWTARTGPPPVTCQERATATPTCSLMKTSAIAGPLQHAYFNGCRHRQSAAPSWTRNAHPN